MRLAPGMPLAAALAFDPNACLPTGRLAMDAGLAQLEWSRDIVTRRLPVSPIHYPPEPGLMTARTRSFDGLHGFLSDSLPDGWGYRLMRKRLAKLDLDIATLSPLDRLALIGDRGRGALVFEPATSPDDDVISLDLDALAKEATSLLEDDEGHLADTLAALAGGSGGARPKVQVGFDERGGISIGDEVAPDHTAWLVKFRGPTDPIDIGSIEEAYARMAAAAGLTISPHRLITAKQGAGYFATRRFDRHDGGGRLHMVSLAGAIEASPNEPSSYDLFMRATRAITRRADDVASVFRRMVFIVLASNRDDHTRQHAYLMNRAGDWRLAPAYDLTFSAGPGGEHYLDIEGEGRRPSRAHVIALGQRHRLTAKQMSETIEQVATSVADWPRWTDESGVTAASTAAIGGAHARVLIDFDAT